MLEEALREINRGCAEIIDDARIEKLLTAYFNEGKTYTRFSPIVIIFIQLSLTCLAINSSNILSSFLSSDTPTRSVLLILRCSG